MTSAPDPHDEDEDEDATPLPPSKSQRKRDALAIRALGERLATLTPDRRRALGLPEDVLDALAVLDRIRAHGARKRQAGFIGARLRRCDTDAIRDALDADGQTARAENARHQEAERWRERLLAPGADVATELSAFLERYPGADRQRIRQHLRDARRVLDTTRDVGNSSPRATRELYRALRDGIALSSGIG